MRIEVPPADPVKARHSPEKGFVVNRLDLWAVAPDGQAQKINIHFLAPDNTENVEANFSRLLRNQKTSPAQAQMMAQLAAQSGFMANPSLFRTAWVVIVPDAPVHACTRHTAEIAAHPDRTDQCRILAAATPALRRQRR